MANTTADKLTYLREAKELIRQAIITMGVDVPANTPLKAYATKILSIQTGIDTTVVDSGISNVTYTSDDFILDTSTGYYEASGAGEYSLNISFTKTVAGNVKLNYKGRALTTAMSATSISMDGTLITYMSSEKEYTDCIIENVSVGSHTITVAVLSDESNTELSIKLISEAPISSGKVMSGYTGFVNDNKIQGTFDVMTSNIPEVGGNLAQTEALADEILGE